MNNFFITLLFSCLIFYVGSFFEFVYGFTCKIVLYEDNNFGGTVWELSTNETLNEIWTGDGNLNFQNDEISSYKYYCASGYSCNFTFCNNNDCNSGWTFDESCRPGGNGTETSISNSYNDELTEIYVSIIATDPPTPFPTSSPTESLCDILSDDVIVSWDDLISGDNGGNNFTASISLRESINNISGEFEVIVEVESKYVIGATFDAFSDYYKDITPNGYLGITYVLDTNKFTPNDRLLSDANTCENRLSSSFTGKNFLNDYWSYTLSPHIDNRLGNDNYGLEYGNQNIWDISLVDDTVCGNIRWKNTFSFRDLWYSCKDMNDSSSYTLIEYDDKISLNLNFYLTLVSPNPLYLELCDSGATDCGQYLIKSLISHPLSIIFSKQQNIISTKDEISIDLFTSDVIGAVFVESSSGKFTSGISNNLTTVGVFELYLLTSVPNFMSLSVDSALILSPSESELESLNGNIDFIDSYTIIEDTSDYGIFGGSDSCLILNDYRCFQYWQISIDVNECPDDGLIFDGSYFFSADFECISNDTRICDDYLSDEPLSITLDSVDLVYRELCDSTIYEIDWDGDISFYNDESYSINSTENEFSFGDDVFVRVSISNDISNYDIFGMKILQCYVCSSNISDASSNILSSCFDAQVDNGLFYVMPDDTDLEFTNIDSNISDTYEDFSFVLPVVSDNIFYVDCVVELTINNGVLNSNRRRSRSRSLLQTNNNGNLIQSFGGYANIVAKEDETDIETDTEEEEGNGNNNSDELGSNGMLLIVLIAAVGVLILLLIGGFIYYCKISNAKRNTAMINDSLKNGNGTIASATASARQSIDAGIVN